MGNQNILSQRYATKEVNEIFSQRGTVLAYRELWIAVMKAQRELGVEISCEDIKKFEDARDDIDLEDIREIEKKTKHDIKANIESFVKAASAPEHIHKGMTSRDLTDNVEQMQILKASKIIFGKYVSILRHLLDKAKEYEDIILTARTHHQPAQATVLGRRFSMCAEELYFHLKDFEYFINNYPLRGIKGPVGTQLDMMKVLGSGEKVKMLEKKIADELGFNDVLNSTGQVYPRSLDLALISKLTGLSSACENFANNMRLMGGYELVTEGFKEGQVGSSAMPHKMNTRSSERINGFGSILKGYLTMASNLSGNQWEEGDVSCSVTRRVAISESFYASDGLCETMLTILNEMGAYNVIIDKELDKYLPFLATTQILMLAVKKGMGREKAHSIIKKYAVSGVLNLRNGGDFDLIEKLGEDKEFNEIGIAKDDICDILDDKDAFIGRAKSQIQEVLDKADEIMQRYEDYAKYEPRDIL
ncbi:adenylosuccinate lyase [Bacteroidota bacterium]